MSQERKSSEEAAAIGVHLLQARKTCGLTLKKVQAATAVDAGQISRFEAGQFKFVTPNLQKVLSFLQDFTPPAERHPDLLHRFAVLLDRSPQHKVAATALIAALEGLR